MVWIPISEAILTVVFAAGSKDGWQELKREIRVGKVSASCLRDGQIVKLEPAWLDYLIRSGEQITPLPVGSQERRDTIPQTDAPTDGALWFESRPGCPPDMPRVVTNVEVDGDQVRDCFPALRAALDGWFDKHLDQLPNDLRQRLEHELHGPWATGRWGADETTADVHEQVRLHWDDLSPLQRQCLVEQRHWQHDPTNEPTRQKMWDLQQEIDQWEDVATPTTLDLAAKKKNLASLRKKLADLDARQSEAQTDNDQIDRAVSQILEAGVTPGTNLSWKEFQKRVIATCGNVRGISVKSLTRSVKRVTDDRANGTNRTNTV